MSHETELVPEKEGGSGDAGERELKLSVPMPKLKEAAKPKKKKLLKTRIEEAGASKGE